MMNTIHRRTRRGWIRMRRWREDERGTSVITTAVTMPLLIVVLFGTFHLFRVMTFKWALDRGVREAAQYLGEESSFWEDRLVAGGELIIGQDPTKSQGVPPQDFMDIEAKRIILSRMMNIINYDDFAPRTDAYNAIEKSMKVEVSEPVLSVFYDPNLPGASPPISQTQGATLKQICERPDRYNKKYQDTQQWRHWENIRFRVYATVDMPVAWIPFLPYTKTPTVTLTFKNRAVGYVECTRFAGQREGVDDPGTSGDKTYIYGREGPALNYRKQATAYFPTVTPVPTETPAPTKTPLPPTITPPP